MSTPPVVVTEEATRVRVTLMMARGHEFLLGRVECQDGSFEHALPSSELFVGESIVACARGIAREIGVTLGAVSVQHLLVTPTTRGSQELVVGVYAQIYPAAVSGSEAGWQPPASWNFFGLDTLPHPLEQATALAIHAGQRQTGVIDLDSSTLALDPGLVSAFARPAQTGRVNKHETPSGGRALLSNGLLAAGGANWGSAALMGFLDLMRGTDGLWHELAAGSIAITAVLIAFRLGVGANPVTAILGERGRPMHVGAGSILAGVCAWLITAQAARMSYGDDPHTQFWSWLLGFGALVLGWLVRPRVEPGPRLRVLRWSFALLATLSFVFPPLRDAIYVRDSAADADLPPPAIDDE